MPAAFCPECEGKIRLSESPRKGDRVTCPACGAYLAVASLSPIELDWAYDEDDDYEYDYDDDDLEDEDYDLEDYELEAD